MRYTDTDLSICVLAAFFLGAILGWSARGGKQHAEKPTKTQGVEQCRVISSGMVQQHAAIVQGLVSRGNEPEVVLKRADQIIGCRP